jgi:hypothetical protein
VVPESLPPHAFPISKNEVRFTAPHYRPEVPTDIPPAERMDPYSGRHRSEHIPKRTLESTFYPLPADPIQGTFLYTQSRQLQALSTGSAESWVSMGALDQSVTAQHVHYPGAYSSQGLLANHCGRLPSPTVSGADGLAEAMNAEFDTYDPMLHSSNFGAYSTHKTDNCEQFTHQIRGQPTCDRRFPCEQCGKLFSGKWEMDRHVKSIHSPPTIGCRACNYKQSRKDLFNEHCKKRHPRESREDLMDLLSTASA